MNKQENPQKKTFWQTLKTAFAWGLGGGFGGAIGWRFGNFIADQIGKLFRLLVAGLMAVSVTYCGAHSSVNLVVPDHYKAPAGQHQSQK